MFKLSLIFTIVVEHVKDSILKWFDDNDKNFNADKIGWVITVPSYSN
jgi:hypothetical protein